MNEDEALAPVKKICPLLKEPCRGPKCTLYVTLQKALMYGDGRTSFPDPEYKLRYRGCGLVVNVPWEPVKLEQNREVDK